MTQALVDAVTTLTSNVASLAQRVADHDTAMKALIAALQTAIANAGAGADPDVAKAIDAISQASSSIAAASDTINTETQAAAAAVLPPTSAPSPSATPAPSGDSSAPADTSAPAAPTS